MRGISVRKSFLFELADRLAKGDVTLLSRLDWVEWVPENFIGRGGKTRRALLQVSEILPVAMHGISLSIGSTDALDFNYLTQIKKLVRDTGARWVTDHICFSSTGGVQLHNLLPLPFTHEVVRHVVERVRQVQDFLEVPFGLENPSYYLMMPGAEMTEAEFTTEILEQANCSMLLDINNVYVNSFNHFPDAIAASRRYLRQIPLERVIEVHIAGHEQIHLAGKERLLDTHGSPVPDPVRLLLKDIHSLMPVKTLLLERERDVPPLNVLVDEVAALWKTIEKKDQSRDLCL